MMRIFKMIGKFIQNCYWPVVIFIVGGIAYNMFADATIHANPNSILANDTGWQIDKAQDKLTDKTVLKAHKTYAIDRGDIQVIANCIERGVLFSFNLFRDDKRLESYDVNVASETIFFQYRLDNGKIESPISTAKYKNSADLFFMGKDFLPTRVHDINPVFALVTKDQTVENLLASQTLLVRLPLAGGQTSDVEIHIPELQEFFEQCPIMHPIRSAQSHVNEDTHTESSIPPVDAQPTSDSTAPAPASMNKPLKSADSSTENHIANENSSSSKKAERTVKHDYPKQLDNLISASDWPKIRSALSFGYSLGDNAELIQWSNKQNNHKGEVIQSGSGVDQYGCRQFRIGRYTDDRPLVAHVDFCANGTAR